MSGMSSPGLSNADRAEITSLDALAVGTTGQFVVKTGTDTYGYVTGVTIADVQTITGAKTFSTSLAVSNADTLTVGGVIVPQTFVVTRVLGALDLSQAIFTAPFACQVIGVSAVWGVAGGAGATVTVEKLTSTTAPGSGTAMLTGALDITATANTVTAGALSATASDLQLAIGNRLGVKLAGVLTGLVGCAVTVHLKRI